MKKMLLIAAMAAGCFLPLGVFAQLANWTVPKAGTKFPVNSSGQINGLCRIVQLKFHPTNVNKFYAVTSQGGLFTSQDQGTNWLVAAGTETLTDNCASICVDYTNDQHLLLGTGDPSYYYNGSGIKVSNDGGASFSSTGLTNCLVTHILQHPLSSNVFVAATNKGIYQSTDGGNTWAAKTSTTIPFCDLKSKAAANSRVLYAATKDAPSKFFRSTDFGNTWTQITGFATATTFNHSGGRIGVTPADTNVVYFEPINGGGMIYKSDNSGLSFRLKKGEGSPYLTLYANSSTSSGQGDYNNCIVVDRTNPAKLWLQAHNTWFSADSGATWTQLTSWWATVHTDMHELLIPSFDNNRLYSCNDGGVWLSTDGGNTWTTKSNGLYAYEIGSNTGIGSPTRGDFVSIGTQDNGRVYGDSTGWFTIGGGDDYAKRQMDYNDFVYYNGTSRQRIPNNSSSTYNLPTANWNVFSFNRRNKNLGFMGENGVYCTKNLASTSPAWTAIGTFTTAVTALHSCIADTNRLYVLVSNGVYVSTNALSPSPTFSFSSLPTSFSTRGSIVAIANNPNAVYVAADNKVYYSSNAGASWTNITYNLPNATHRRILAEEYGGTQELVFLATNNAVYYKKAGQTSWTNYSTNLPVRRSPSEFSMFDDGTRNSKIWYASYGRAIFESKFDNIRAASAEIVMNSDSTITCSSPSVTFSESSVGMVGAMSYTWTLPGASPATGSLSAISTTYSVSGTYSITLQAKDATNTIFTKTITKYIQVIPCAPDTVPGNAAFIDGSLNYLATPNFSITNANSLTLSAWIKVDTAQASFAGIIFTSSSPATGLDFYSGTKIGYHFNSSPSTYNYSGGPTVPLKKWTHIALVITPSNATIYMNGVPYVNNVANPSINITSGFLIGNDRNNTARTMKGQIDEVCIYSRALSQNEIREQMHLTKNHNSIDPALLAYYQFNEVGNVAYNRSGSLNATYQMNDAHVISTAPVGSGNSERMTITTTGVKNFAAEGLNLNFPSTPLPNGEICVTRLNIPPDSVPLNNTFANTAQKYWIINNYGSNSTFSYVASATMTGFGSISAAQATAPWKFKLHQRETGGYLASGWSKIDSASAATAGVAGVLTFTGTGVTSFNKQFTITRSACFSATSPALSVSNSSLCSGSSVTLSVSSGTLNDATSWGWYKGSCGGTSVGNGLSLVVSPTTTTTYYARGEGGCAAAGICSSITVTVNTIPASPSTLSGSSPICAGSVNVYSVAAVSGATSYSWTVPGGWSGTSITNTISLTSGSVSGNVTVRAVNSCGSSAASTKSVTVNTIPASPSTLSGNSPLCAGSVNVYSVAAVSGATSYSWTVPGGWSGTSTTNSISVTSGSVSGNISVVAANSCGSSAASTKSVTVNTIPASPSTLSGNSPVCAGSVNVYSVAAVAGATSYSWTVPGGWSGTSTTNSISLTSGSVSGNISVVAANSCGSSAATTKSVTVNTIPANPAVISGNSTVCAGWVNSYSITAVAGATSYSWTFPGGWSGASTTNSISLASGSVGGNITVVATNSCGSSAASTKSVTVSAIPVSPAAISGSSVVCAGSSYSYTASAVLGATSYSWSVPGGWSGVSSTNTIVVTSGSTGGSIQVWALNICGISAAFSKSVTVRAAIVNTQTVSLCAGQTLTIGSTVHNSSGFYTDTIASAGGCDSIVKTQLTIKAPINVATTLNGATLSANQNNAAYQWIDCQTMTQVSGAVSQTFTPSTNGSYAVSVTFNNCQDTSACQLVNSVGIAVNQSGESFDVLPNPTSGLLTVITPFSSGTLHILTVLGQEVMSLQVQSRTSMLDISNLAAGIYYVKVSASGKQFIRKIVKQD